MSRTVLDALSFSDSAARGSRAVTVSAADTQAVSDAIVRAVAIQAAASDSFATTEAINRLVAVNTLVADAFTLSEQLSSLTIATGAALIAGLQVYLAVMAASVAALQAAEVADLVITPASSVSALTTHDAIIDALSTTSAAVIAGIVITPALTIATLTSQD